MDSKHIKDPETLENIHALITSCGGDPNSYAGALVSEVIQTALKLLFEGHDIGQVKLINRCLKEMRYAYRIFNGYPHARCLSMFGSARTPESHPDYLQAKALSAALAHHGWMVITGAADGIMKAGHEGSQAEGSFGLSIYLPAEEVTNQVMKGDPKLISFRYFFTRKLMFISHADAVAVFPGGFGTHDEMNECLTLMQTGKTNIIPLILLEGEGGSYWSEWQTYIDDHLMARGMISREDENLYYIAPSVEAAVEHVERFYSRFHSYRYVRNVLVIRIKATITEEQLAALNQEFVTLVAEGTITQREAFEEETDHLTLPRIAFTHTRRRYGLVRALIDRINSFA